MAEQTERLIYLCEQKSETSAKTEIIIIFYEASTSNREANL